MKFIKNKNEKNLVLICSVLVLILVVYLIYKHYTEPFTKYNNLIEFQLYNIKNNLIKNTNWEYSEQELLGKYLKKNDNVLQLGGNIGTSCIYVDKIIDKNNTNICVEPNPRIIDVLKKNKTYNKSNFDIVYGVISEKQHLKLSNKEQTEDKNLWGSKVLNDGDIDITSYSLNKLPNIDKINVLFADCEGCLEKFIDKYEDFLKQLRLVIYEADQKKICDYKKIETILKKHNFKNLETSGKNYVWKK